MNMQPDKIPDPHSIEAEQSLLGSILINNQAYGLVESIVRSDDFFEPVHSLIFEIFGQLIGTGKLASPITVLPFLPERMVIAGDMSLKEYIAQVAAAAVTVVNAPDFARTIREYADRRELMQLGRYLAAPEDGQAVEDTASFIVDKVEGISRRRSVSGIRVVSVEKATMAALDQSAHAFQQDGKLSGISFGVSELDGKTHGAQGGDLIVIAARPSMGKSALLLSAARSFGYHGEPGVIFSLEMTAEQMAMRMMSDDLYDFGKKKRLQYWQIQQGKYHGDFFDGLIAAQKRLAALPIIIDPTPSLSIAQIAMRTRQLHRKNKIRWFAVDHIGLSAPSDRYRGNKNAEIGEITGGMKALAKELGISAIALSQLSRDVERRDDKRPKLSDLRDSGNVEQDADVVMMLYRESYYLERSEPPASDVEAYTNWQTKMEMAHNKLDVLIEKQRMGPTGTCRVYIDIGHNAIRDFWHDSPEIDPDEGAAYKFKPSLFGPAGREF